MISNDDKITASLLLNKKMNLRGQISKKSNKGKDVESDESNTDDYKEKLNTKRLYNKLLQRKKREEIKEKKEKYKILIRERRQLI
jgi:hypothetical protein